MATKTPRKRATRPQGTPEGQLLRLSLDYLAAKRILAFRMNSGMMKNPAGRPIRFGVPGMADILAFPREMVEFHDGSCREYPFPIPTWLEVKAGTKQSDLQKSFQAQVEAEGHVYRIIRSLEDLQAIL